MPDGTVIASGLNLRAALKTGKVVKVLRRSSRVEILGEETWYRVRTRDGLEGYVFGDFIEKDVADVGVGPPAVDPTSPSTGCVLESYRNERFIGQPVTADVDFFPFLDRLAEFAARSTLKIFVTSSARDPGADVRGAIVKPATRSNHLVGHAIDMNLQSESGRFFNSKMLKELDTQPQYVRRFIERIRKDPVLRWGGDFRTRDVVHIDDALNVRFPEVWDAKFATR